MPFADQLRSLWRDIPARRPWRTSRLVRAQMEKPRLREQSRLRFGIWARPRNTLSLDGLVDGGRLLAGVEPEKAPSRAAAVEPSITITGEDWAPADLLQRFYWCGGSARKPIFLRDGPDFSGRV